GFGEGVWKFLSNKFSVIVGVLFDFCKRTLYGKLLAVIAIKILFLIVFWNLVLSRQAVHVNQEDMTHRFISEMKAH
ncbi:MAG: hypothetical protein EBU36_05685, partial [Verrucomicrobia bacterium]|nr:hypothetical protein [Verrucomicrobiota bacterium]